MEKYAPVLVFTYNRVDHTKKTCRQHRNFRHFQHLNFPDVDSIAIFGILSIPIFRIGKDMVFPPFEKRYFLNVIEFSGLSAIG